MANPLRFAFWMKKTQGAPSISRRVPPVTSRVAPVPSFWAPGTARLLTNKGKPASFWIKSSQALVLAVAVCFSLGATDSSARYHDLNHRLMCTCGCAQMLGECNHVGCPSSGQELSELSADIAAGMSDQQIFSAFTAKYGATVLAAPTTQGFDLVAWIAPFAVFGAALLGTILLIRRWAGIAGAKAQAAALEPAIVDPADRERKEKIRRETGIDGGF